MRAPPDTPAMRVSPLGVPEPTLRSYPVGDTGRGRVPTPANPTARTIDDRLARVLNPLHPRLFDIATSEDARKALAETLHSIEALRSP